MIDLRVRPLEGAEVDVYFRMSAPRPVPAGHVPDWQTETLTAPWHRPEQLRGAFRGGELLGGYVIHERWLRIGRARLLTGCIGNVFVRPEHRHRGVASAMMQEAIGFATANRHALLLLDGITGFYGKFGYADVFDPTWHAFKREAVLAQPSPYAVRPAMREDAEPLLDLYRRHVGAFDRTLEEQRWRLPHGFVAVDRDGAVRGYMHPPGGDRKERVGEVAADDWSAGLALLQHHASLSEAEELRWAIPQTAPLTYWLIDQFHVRSTTERWADGGWMARPAHIPTLLEALKPLRHDRAMAYGGEPADFVLEVDDSTLSVAFGGGEFFTLPAPVGTAPRVRLTPQAFVQLLFGFRPAAGVQSVPRDLVTAFDALFPAGSVWIPASDGF